MNNINFFDCHVTELPLPVEQFETVAILKKLATANRALAELKGVLLSIPNQAILLNTLSLQEAKHSSEIENIITTQDELFKADLNEEYFNNPAAKEVQKYSLALHYGFLEIQKDKIIRLNTLIGVQNCLEENKAGLRVLPNTVLKNSVGKTVYTPPQHKDDIQRLMNNLITFINDDEQMPDTDPLIKMAIIHHQFESIHPFYDGNGRTGRILNILYLVQQELLDIPVLYLSRYLIQHKQTYYELLQKVRETGQWEEWTLFMLDAVADTAKSTLILIQEIKKQMQTFKHRLRDELPKIYRQELLNQLFKHPYTKIEFIEKELNVSWQTAKRYLEEITKIGLLEKAKIGKYNYYINKPLFELFLNY
ncbi:Fic family protein [Gallibacterium trehalosifermentans]|uniref:Protein adenylyltransferase n=1 Tax=Gallibacterium trehalosifermentans TaxID=516935 RepID=A0ABV6GZ36_9PAST